MNNHQPHVIIGAGLAGLACAVTLHRRGIASLIVEASDQIGGRVQTDLVDGFLLDRGFQVYLDSYPEGRLFFNDELLDGGEFRHGASVRCLGAFHRLYDPRREPATVFETLFCPLIPLSDKIKLLGFLWRALRGPFPRPETSTTLHLLKHFGFSSLFIERFWRPFLSGVFLENELSTPADFFLFTFKMFATGTATLPAAGMGSLPRQLAAQMPPDSLRLNAPVSQIAPGRVILQSGEEIQAARIVVATEATGACRLLGLPESPSFRGVICVYFTAPSPPHDEPILMLNAETCGLIRTLTVQTNVSPTYSLGRKPLICISVIPPAPSDDVILESKLRAECAAWFGEESVRQWRLLKIYRIPHALPDSHFIKQYRDVLRQKEAEGIYVCGDWTEAPSINGALRSGRITAEKIAVASVR